MNDSAFNTHIDRPGVRPPASPHVLDQLLRMIQGGVSSSIADPGLAALSRPCLEQISASAQRQADQCGETTLLMMELLQQLLDEPSPQSPDLLRRLSRQQHACYLDQQRWQSLADNASYYRRHPRVAERIACWFTRNS
ncbi:hypothetical protein [Pseudoxanthomonas dokdonensis]|uniref:Uncharacterized protein n=1 Tax=Pseudoxanthomonas dokdonensis TaxID=344882 RepID=A0A0R0CKE8_9GAMM|nr:hypothetical protein [Pseudoxanthomonas dokdonensis]KRG70016.1 hypothetical protein ABB29_07170 [Pseudoxanthomonas dokdonensis]